MSNQTGSKLPKWPFFVGVALLFGLASGIYAGDGLPTGPWQEAMIMVCVMAAVAVGVAPYMLDHRAASRLAQADTLAGALIRLKGVEQVAGQIAAASSQWQAVQEQADRTATGVREMSDRMSAEARAFTQTLQRMNDGERAVMRVEVEKLRRAEAEWLQVLV